MGEGQVKGTRESSGAAEEATEETAEADPSRPGDIPPSGARRKLTESGAVILAAALLSSGALAALAMPRPVAPTETPGLVLPVDAAAQMRARDRALAEEAPTGIPAETLLDAYRRHGLAERHGSNPETYRYDRRAIVRAAALLRQESGDEAIDALRAQVTEHLDEGLRGRLDPSDQDALMGTFIETMSSYGIVEDGVWRAPDLVVRTLFKARFNAALRLELIEGLSPVEVEAYWGWLALEAHDAPTDRRLVALGAYEEVTGREFAEARGTLLFAAGEFLAAAEAFEGAYQASGNVRLRNHALAAMAEAAP
ncbi:MAG: hypothetical protein DRJ42_05480 [Deltaproteobacteria bacterium]|nr:MAG: hypothetical protein DRJ42_05480 [Deltaproteobacteria bacterium]